MDTLEKISKEDAKILKQKWYFTGLECSNGHLDKRYTNTGICYGCKRSQNNRSNAKNPETLKVISSRTYQKNKESKLEQSKRWAQRNREKSNAIKSKWKQVHREQHLEQAKKYSKNQRKDPFKRISKNMSKAIWQSLKGKKGGSHWLSFVDFTIEELTIHLESKFKEGMTWENYGKYWHVDHIRPLSWFNLELEFKDAWCLGNLQPLEAVLNLRKNNRYEG
jgi:hypothetical protein